ncbi:MAG: SH3 domain-containing protein [Alphaproteobacteria bacterium]|nr:SH3 domain-containing protein [Alphaproteobacteria bacterium]
MKKYIFYTLFGLLFNCISTQAADLTSLPRFASLRHNQVNLRTGPGNRYPIMWVYQEKGYPVEIIDEYELWRQIREVDGTTGWIHRTQITGVRHALVLEECSLINAPRMDGKTVAIAQKGTIGRILKCPKNSDYCLLDFGSIKGWMAKNMFYGLYKGEIID